MKTTINFLSFFITISVILFTSCKGPQGDIGPAGATGAAGAAGTAGPAGSQGSKGDKGDTGATGNANVIQITYGSKTHTGGELPYNLTGLSQSQVNSSLFLTYVNPSSTNLWYQIPGYTSGGVFQYRIYVSQTATGTPILYINRVAGGTGSDIFTATRILVIPANDLRNGRNANLDYSDYEAVKKYYNLKD